MRWQRRALSCTAVRPEAQTRLWKRCLQGILSTILMYSAVIMERIIMAADAAAMDAAENITADKRGDVVKDNFTTS